MDFQHTIAGPVTLSDRGLFTGQSVNVTFRPAPTEHGIVFVRTDLKNQSIPALIQYVIKRPRHTVLKNGDAMVMTTEHVLSAAAGLGVDNLIIEIDAPELPGFDGSAKPFVDALLQAGLVAQDQPRRRLVVREPLIVRQDDAFIAIVPDEEPLTQIVYELDYGKHPIIGRQLKQYDLKTADQGGDFATQIAPARTFSLEAEARAMLAMGLGKHLSPEKILVIGDGGPLAGNAFRFTDEPVRHKILDLIGDLSLIGGQIQGRIVTYKSGHGLNHSIARELHKQLRRQKHEELALSRSVVDIRKISEILPHRYPMLLVDRVVEITPKRALGIKNVTMNEPFFTGHFPTAPIMPGVLIIEALAQLSGILISQSIDCKGKIAVLMSLDRVKIRRPVTPGDQLMMECELIRARTQIAHTRCRAYVGQDAVAEAEVKFMIVDPGAV